MNIAIILSGGVGSRMGSDIPKQYIDVAGKPVLHYCLKTFFNHPRIDAVVIGVAEEWADFVHATVQSLCPHQPVFYAPPGETRQYSIYNALKVAAAVSQSADDLVIVHDGARPLVSAELISRCLDGCREADGVMPVVAVKDTTYLSEDGKHIKALLDRSQLWAGQAPEAFRLNRYLAAHEQMTREELLTINGSTELAYKAGLDCQMVAGDPMNFKITTPEDLESFRTIIMQKGGQQ